MTDSTATDSLDQQVNNQYVTFQVTSEVFGFPMDQVLEIIRIPTTVAVPLTPDTLIGLANLRGGVLPIIDLRKLLEFENKALTEQSRVVVVDTGAQTGRVGLVVDRVLQVKTVDDSEIDRSSKVKSSVDEEVVDGVIKAGDGEQVTQLLNVHEIIKQNFASMVSERIADAVQSNTKVLQNEEKDEDDTSNQLVSFLVDEQEYAFDLMGVEEIVRVPDNIASMPKTDAHVMGLIELRGRLLPLISLRNLFGLENAPLCEQNRVVIVSVARPSGIKEYAGFIVDQVREVLRVTDDVLQEVPDILNKGMDDDIDKICRLENGKRLVSIINSENVFGHQVVKEAMSDEELKESQMQGQDTQSEVIDDEDNSIEQLVVFLLSKQEYAVSIDHVQEITRIPDQMDKVPKTPKFIEGVVNLRGTVLPVIDMRTRFGIDKMDGNDRQRIVVLNIAGTKTGFVVDSVAQVLRLPKEQIEDSPNLSEEQNRVMGKVVNLKNDKRIIQVLEVDELLSKKEVSAIEKQSA
ncbi:chemotaxis protein CheW [Glaciecola sp. KUL10]|uniref:chemotaxis protein CheW n=1 Tax=Glaciecola sp. (strain KUL10) TaxID=2161813 RepID=UPI000D788D6E|nr:chemotaxis protein CheW [Glaciecola sp. KUL10]GBL05923.1 chemotaxis CheW protein [Glaciecola sp. KUL10]